MTRIAFAADLHVDTYGTRIDPDTGLNARLVDYLASVEWMARDARERGADALIVAGDFTERRHCPAWLAALIRGALAHGPDVQRYIRGNHDGEVGMRSIVNVLDDGRRNVDDPGGRRGISRITVDVGVPGVGLVMLPYFDRHWTRATAEDAAADESAVRRSVADDILATARGGFLALGQTDVRHRILVLHQTIAGAWLSDAQQAFLGDVDTVVDGSALAAIGYDLVVAGHLHRHQTIDGDVRRMLYPGSIERVDFGEELQPKGYVIAELGDDVRWEFVENPKARRYLTVDYATGDFHDPTDAIVRVRNVPRDADLDEVRRIVLAAGAFDVYSIERVPAPDRPAGGISERQTPFQALYDYFADNADRDEIVVRGGDLLEEAVHG